VKAATSLGLLVMLAAVLLLPGTILDHTGTAASLSAFVLRHASLGAGAGTWAGPAPHIPAEGFRATVQVIISTPQGNLTGEGSYVADASPSQANVMSLMTTATFPSGAQSQPAPSTTVQFQNGSSVEVKLPNTGSRNDMGVVCNRKPDPTSMGYAVQSALSRALTPPPDSSPWTFIGNTFVMNKLVAGFLLPGANGTTMALFNNVFGNGLVAISGPDAKSGASTTIIFDDLVEGKPEASELTLPPYLAATCA